MKFELLVAVPDLSQNFCDVRYCFLPKDHLEKNIDTPLHQLILCRSFHRTTRHRRVHFLSIGQRLRNVRPHQAMSAKEGAQSKTDR